MTLTRVRARYPWILPTALAVFGLLALGAMFNLLAWDKPIAEWVVESRTDLVVTIARKVSFLGSNRVVFVVSAIAALVAWRRCPRLAIAIVVVAAARPLFELVLKELVARDRPNDAQLVRGTGHSFPSGHPLATAASWCLLPLVAALYTRRRAVWWSISIAVWVLAVLVAASRVVLGVHWPSDVAASLLLTVLGVAAVEIFVERTHPAGWRNLPTDEPHQHSHAPPDPDPGITPCSRRLPRAG